MSTHEGMLKNNTSAFKVLLKLYTYKDEKKRNHAQYCAQQNLGNGCVQILAVILTPISRR